VTVDAQEMDSDLHGETAANAPYTAIAFLIGCATSIAAGYIGMKIAVLTNSRTTFNCCESVNAGFLAAFRGGQVLGFVLVGLAVLVLHLIIVTFKSGFFDPGFATLDASAANYDEQVAELVRRLFELVAGFGLGGSTVALFGRVGGGIYTKAADVGADLVGKNLKDLKEDDKENPGTIADNVGDNVGDIAGMGSDLFGSLAESTCAALVVSSTSIELITTPDALFFPLFITSAGIIASFGSVLFVHTTEVTTENVQKVLKIQIGLSTLLMTLAVWPCTKVLPTEGFNLAVAGDPNGLDVKPMNAFWCIALGLWSGCIIGFSTEYYTSNAYEPVAKTLVDACKMGAAPNVIQGLALGYLSCIIPVLCLAATIGYAFKVAGLYGVGISALGMLGSLPVALTIDGYGPISDNAGGIAEMTGLPPIIRVKTDALDAAGNTTAAIGKGFAIGSACLVGLALFGAFITRIQQESVDILKPVQFCGLLIGAMLPYAFSALTMKAVGDAAIKMMKHIIEDFEKGQELKSKGKEYKPDYDGCIGISTKASLKLMVAPGVLVLGSPLLAGFLFGPDAVAGLLAGIIVSGVQVAISASNTGGAWDNTKKEIEKTRA
jgi:H(+)-translocating pyrophosphatase